MERRRGASLLSPWGRPQAGGALPLPLPLPLPLTLPLTPTLTPDPYPYPYPTPNQVAHFYNNIETQIVRSQKPLLLDFALTFEQLATNPRAQSTADKKGGKVITWSDPNQLEEYIQQLPLTLA